MTRALSVQEARDRIAAIPDPEIPVLTIADLGILRDVAVAGDGAVEVTITPTYSGCPAMEAIRADIERALPDGPPVRVRTVLSPAWTTDWMTEDGKRKLAAYGIAPPSGTGPRFVPLSVCCPRCGSLSTRELTRFSSTACKALYRCEDCSEPFEHFKAI